MSWYLFPFAQQVNKSLVEATRSIKGAIVENNKFCVSVHYRNVDKKVELDRLKFPCPLTSSSEDSSLACFVSQDWKLVTELVDGVLKAFPRLKVTTGRKVGRSEGSFTKRSSCY